MDVASNSVKPRIKKFVYKSRGIALRGSIRKPFYQDLGRHAVVQTFAGSSGDSQSRNNNFSLPNFVRYASAESEIVADVVGQEPDRLFRTRVTTVVEGLNVLNGRITADRIVSSLSSIFVERLYPKVKAPRITPAGSRFDNLQIDGVLQNVPLPPAFSNDPAAFAEGIRDEEPPIPEPPIPIILAAPFHKDGLGTVFFAEWVWVHPDERKQQALVMLRLALGSDDGMAADVGLCISDGSGIDP
jgi:hypothetical protein